MSYARFSNYSAVYIYASVHGGIECCGCHLHGDCFIADSTQEMIDHVEAHRQVGDIVPEGIEDALWEDDQDNFGEKA